MLIKSEAELRKLVKQVVRKAVASELANHSTNHSESESGYQYCVTANWKMHMSLLDTKKYFNEFKALHQSSKLVHTIICPPSYLLLSVLGEIEKYSDISLGAQNMYYEQNGAFTGEISPQMLCDAGCSYVILGHSERRTIFEETDEIIAQKVAAALKSDLIPILCIGETLKERQNGITFSVLKNQLVSSLAHIRLYEKLQNLIIAYEPIWAIGTGLNATPEQAQEAHIYIRETVSSLYNFNIAKSIKILYGGSVKPSNALNLINQPDIDGFLVGGASLDAQKFNKIIQITQESCLP